jgi:hypothetical protein
VDAKECPTNLTVIEGTGVIPQAEACDLFVGQLMLPESLQFESRAEWSAPGVVVPPNPDLLLPGEVSYISQHRAILEDIWDAREDPESGPVSSTTPMTMFQLRQQMEAKTRETTWTIGGAVLSSIVAAAIGSSLCLWRHRQIVLAIRARLPGRRTLAGNPRESTPAYREDEPTGTTDSDVVNVGTSRDQGVGTQHTTMVFK